MGLLSQAGRSMEAKSGQRMKLAQLEVRDLLQQVLAVELEQRDLLRWLANGLHAEAVKNSKG
jgi:hypothetical protein